MSIITLNTRSLPDSAVTTAKIAADAITDAKIADDSWYRTFNSWRS